MRRQVTMLKIIYIPLSGPDAAWRQDVVSRGAGDAAGCDQHQAHGRRLRGGVDLPQARVEAGRVRLMHVWMGCNPHRLMDAGWVIVLLS